MAQYFTGKGYGVSQYVDVTGVPLLTVTNKHSGKVITAFDRVAVQFDPTIKAPHTISEIDGGRMDLQTSSALKKAVGGTSAQELDHIISLELGGSNQLANLGLDTNIPGTKNNVTDTFENQLGAAVQAGAMSLADAWAKEAAAKGKLLAEDVVMQTNNNWASAASTALGAAGKLLTGGVRGTLNKNLEAQIKQDIDTLSKNPYDINLRTKIFTEQIDLTSQQLNLSKADAAAYTKVYTARYAQSKGLDATEVTAGLEANLQSLLNVSGKNPNILGIDNTVWINVAGTAAAGAGIFAVVGVIGFIIALFLGGGEAVAAAAGGSGVAGFLAGIGVNTTAIGVLATTELIAGALGGIAFLIPMITKQMLDAAYIAPSLISTGLKNDIDLLKKQGVSFGGSTKVASASGGGYAPHNAPRGNILISAVSSGIVGNASAFTPRPIDVIETATDLTTAAQNNLHAFLTSLPGILGYDIILKTHVTADDGSIRFGGTNRVVAGYSKKGVPHYKNITNKFAVLEIYYVPSPRKRVILDTVVLGPIDEANYTPHEAEIAEIVTHLSEQLVIASSGIDSHPLQPATLALSSGQNSVLPAQASTTQENPTPQAPVLSPTAQPACTTTTLQDFYQLQGSSLPSIQARAALYEQAGLGTATTYTGGVEQNAKLLQHLQAALGCFVAPSAAPSASATVAVTPALATILPTTGPGIPTPNLAALQNIKPYNITVPTDDGLFVAVGGYGETLYAVKGKVVYAFNMSSPGPDGNGLFSADEAAHMGQFGNSGAQANVAISRLRTQTGIDYNALPRINLGDLGGVAAQHGLTYASGSIASVDALKTLLGGTPSIATQQETISPHL